MLLLLAASAALLAASAALVVILFLGSFVVTSSDSLLIAVRDSEKWLWDLLFARKLEKVGVGQWRRRMWKILEKMM